MTEDDKKKMMKKYDLFVADDITIICAASVLSQALKANGHMRVDILEKAYDNADFGYAEGVGDTIEAFMEALANMPTPKS